MNRILFRRIVYLLVVFSMNLMGTRCATPNGESHVHGEVGSVKTYPKDYVHPLSEVNLEKVIDENKGLRVLKENATTVHDYYRGGVQEKAQGERLLGEEKWEEARIHFERSDRFLEVVLNYFTKDEAYRNIYGDHVVIFLPNLLLADNYLKLIKIYHKLKMDDEIYWASREGKKYLSFSQRSVKTELAFQIRMGFEQAYTKR